MTSVLMIRRVLPGLFCLAVVFAAPMIRAASVEGMVSNSRDGSPVPAANVFALPTDLISLPIQAISSESGAYALTVDAGSYFVVAQKAGFSSELYLELPCCDSTEGATIITVDAAQTLPGINFTLSEEAPPATFSGVIRRAADSTVLANVSVAAIDANGSSVATTTSAANGSYTLTVPPGAYRVAVSGAPSPLLDEHYPDVQCRFFVCAGTATVFDVISGQSVQGLDFALAPIATVSISLMRGLDSAPINGLVAWRRDSALTGSADEVPVIAGAATLEVLSGGSVRIAAGSNECGVNADEVCLAELHPSLPCPHLRCAFLAGTAVTMAKGEEVVLPGFVLGTGASIAGTVSGAGNALPGADVSIYLHEPERHVGRGAAVASATTDGSGNYRIDGLDADNYFAIADAQGYVAELFDNVPCAFNSCEVDGGTPIATTLGVLSAGRDFDLVASGAITGTVIEDGVGLGIVGAVVHAHTASGAEVRSTPTGTLGNYALSGLPPGNYFLRYTHPEFVAELHDNLPCPAGNCDVMVGTAVVVNSGAGTDGINATLLRSSGSPPERTLLYLNSCQPSGCVVQRMNNNDSRFNHSTITANGQRTLGAFSGTAELWAELVQCVRDVMQPYYIDVTDIDPCLDTGSNCTTAHHEAMIAGLPTQLGFSNGVAGVSPYSCGIIPNSITFTFANLNPTDLLDLCWTATQEVAHSFGLAHEMYCPDSMTYLTGCGFKRYTDVLADVGTQGPCQPSQECQCGPTQQNAHQSMLGALGVNNTVFGDSFEDDVVLRMRARRELLQQTRGTQAPMGTCATMDRPADRSLSLPRD